MLMVVCHCRGKECFLDSLAFCFMFLACYVQQDVRSDASYESITRASPRFVTAARICLSSDSSLHIIFVQSGSVQSFVGLYVFLPFPVVFPIEIFHAPK